MAIICYRRRRIAMETTEAAQFPCVSGGNFTAHVIIVSAGEDIAMRIISFSQRESRGICVLSACGLVSNVTLRQHNSFGGTLTYEGRYEILSLTGSFMPTDNGIANSRIGGLSVSLAGPDGSVLGGGLAGLLVAASPVQVVLGSFTPKPRRQRAEPIAPATPGFVSPVSEGGYGAQNVDFASPSSSFLSMPSFNSDEDSRELETDNEVSTLSEDSYVNDADNLENSGEP